MSNVTRKGKYVRPAWNHQLEGSDGRYEMMNLEMLESIRNTMEQARDELKTLNRLLHCSNFTDIPNVLRGIRRKLTSRKERTGKQ